MKLATAGVRPKIRPLLVRILSQKYMYNHNMYNIII